jgi:hypothetical protein
MKELLRSPLLDLAETILAPYRIAAASMCRAGAVPEIEQLRAHLLAATAPLAIQRAALETPRRMAATAPKIGAIRQGEK